MAHRGITLIAALLAGCVALAACGLIPRPSSPTAAPADTAVPASETPLPAPTSTAEVRPATPTRPAPTPTTRPSATPTPTLQASATVSPTVSAGVDKAEFVADVTVPDGTSFTPGTAFVKTWQLRNTGTTTWTTGYALAFAKGDRMDGPETVPLTGTVAPGQSVELSLNLIAPQKLGAYTGFWLLRNAGGATFGIGALSNEPVYVQINVAAVANASPEPTGVPGPLQVTALSLSVDRPSFTGACPQTLVFTGAITTAGAGNMTYRLEASAEQPGFTFNLPPANNATLTGAGPRTFGVRYELEFRGSVNGLAWLHVLAPIDMTSDKVAFNLVCQAQPGAGG